MAMCDGLPVQNTEIKSSAKICVDKNPDLFSLLKLKELRIISPLAESFFQVINTVGESFVDRYSIPSISEVTGFTIPLMDEEPQKFSPDPENGFRHATLRELLSYPCSTTPVLSLWFIVSRWGQTEFCFMIYKEKLLGPKILDLVPINLKIARRSEILLIKKD